MPTDQRPNLDYEPGPVGASYSRLGPPSEAVNAARTDPGALSLEKYRHETGRELFPAAGRRRWKRKRP